VKVRIGYGLGAVPSLFPSTEGEMVGFGAVVDQIEALGFDSLWFPERVNSPQLDPVVAMAFVAGRTERLKFGSAVSVVPGRNPVLLAKMLASLDVVSGGRCLPVVGLGIADTAEHQAFGVDRHDRGPWLNEVLPLLRRLWSEESVDHDGPRFTLRGARVLPHPVQDPLEVWMGGAAPSELRRTGRLADGWLASFTTPEAVAEGIGQVNHAAVEAGRSIDPEHFGVLLPYVPPGAAVSPQVRERAATRQPHANPDDIIAESHGQLGELIDRYVEVGASKFVVFPVSEPSNWETELTALAPLLNRQT